MKHAVKAVLLAAAVSGLAACGTSYTADTYSASAVQQANKVDQATVIGYRQVKISANGTVGAVAGGAVGGILGSQSERIGINSALGTVGGTTLGGIIGTTIEHVTGDTKGWEYIVRKKDGDLLSVTQQDEKPIAIGQKVLVISGNQARIVPDYSVIPENPASKSDTAKQVEKTEPKPVDNKPVDNKPADIKAPESKATEQTPPADTKSAETKPAETKAEPPKSEPGKTEPVKPEPPKTESTPLVIAPVLPTAPTALIPDVKNLTIP